MSIKAIVPHDLTFKISRFGGALAILSYPISITLSQAGLLLAILGWLGWSIQQRRSMQAPDRTSRSPANLSAAQETLQIQNWPMHLQWPAVLLAALGIFGVLFLSLFLNAFLNVAPGDFLKAGLKAEPKDVFLILGAFWALAYGSHARGRADLMRWLGWALIILLVIGFASIWSRYRLSKIPAFFQNNWMPGPNLRYQHHLGTFMILGYPVHFYMPIGLMNTHLTYAGLLMLGFPYLCLRVLDPFIRGPLEFLLGPDRWQNLRHLAWLALALIILVLNNGRSAILGALFAGLAGIAYFSVTVWKQRALRLLPLLLAGLLSLAAIQMVSGQIHHRFNRIISALVSGKKKHTDHQRNLIWNGSLELANASPVIGTGPGAYEKNIKNHIIQYSRQHPHLWIYYSLAQRGHAHNDYLHLLVIGGLPALLSFLFFWALLLAQILKKQSGELEYWKFGPLALLAAGFFQCYFQDDEILLPFWIYIGLVLSTFQTPSRGVPTGKTNISNAAR